MKCAQNPRAWTSHPRPQMRREEYMILQDGWELNSRPIRMPYPPQSRLSGYDGPVGDELCYTCKFSVPDAWKEGRVILHFGAVDQIAQVAVNGVELGTHEGGYLPFTFDVTEVLTADSYLELTAIDELSKDYPYGKQCKKPHGMWYTPVSGIWQQVWLEHVPDLYIEKLEITPSLDRVKISVICNKPAEQIRTVITLPGGKMREAESADGNFEIEIPNPHLWTPDDPYLYDLTVYAGADCVQSYFALRTIEICRIDGVRRVCLNQKPIFLHGVLDQGYFEDGLFLPESEAGYEQDILNMKQLGFNLLRKHIKVEPECFYYACDRLGMLVMQDMVNNGSYCFLRDTALPTIGVKRGKDAHRNRSPKVRDIFRRHACDTITHLYNHPCIVAYTIFNEGWGQFLADEMYDMVKKLDSTRLVDATSGWFVQKKNDFDSEHIYFRLKKLCPKERPLFVTECGGYQYLLADHFYGKKSMDTVRAKAAEN